MTDHDHSTCDALPLAVALTQYQKRYAKLEAVADRLDDAATAAHHAMLEIGLGTYGRKPHEMTATHQWQKIQMIERICLDLDQGVLRQALTAYREHKDGGQADG